MGDMSRTPHRSALAHIPPCPAPGNCSFQLLGLPPGVVAQDEDDEDDEEEKTFPADSPVLLRELKNNSSQYWVWVQASNALGTARSAPRHLSLRELVVPALPVPMGAETTDTSPARTTTRWRSRTRLRDVRCQERHRARGTPTWHVGLCDKVPPEGPRWQHELQSDTEFVFQARCRLGSARSPWSAWSPPFVYRTPEAVAVLVPPAARSLLVTARNAKGASSPASIPLNWAAAPEEFPAPAALEVQQEQQSRVLVQWQRPQPSQSPLLWFILEWLSSPQQEQEQYSWERIPNHQTHAYIPAPAEAPLLGSTHSASSQDDDIRVFLGLSLSVVGLSVLFAVAMFKKSVRKRVKASLVSLLPRWMFEDFPHMENSTVVKSLQDKADFPSASLQEPFLDPVVSDVQEVPEQERPQCRDPEARAGVAEPRKLCLLDKINLVLNSSLEFPGHGHGAVPEQRWEPGPEQMLVPEELLSCLRATNRDPASPGAWQGCSEGSWDWG
ncbi:interleukin-23 receptor [Geospiza fortis]|uniref:Interleukin-23 receptor n=1 Tax=Geospiza fortis TaxID=48883 RepID=A0A8N5EYC5_GEOFO|nr:interleukin-23 receptor [Geospiza fortis]